MFGFSEEQFAAFGLSAGLGAFILYMLFVVFRLARDSGAGRFGTVVLFLVLALGMIGFVAKGVIERLLDI